MVWFLDSAISVPKPAALKVPGTRRDLVEFHNRLFEGYFLPNNSLLEAQMSSVRGVLLSEI